MIKMQDNPTTVKILDEFKQWCDENLNSMAGHKRMELEPFGDLVDSANKKLNELTNFKADYTSFVCGIAAGLKMMTLPENEK